MGSFGRRTISVLLLSWAGCSVAGEITAAVAANFTATLQALSTEFEAQTEHRVRIVPGSTGKHYAQIRHGAPFDVFFAADAARPARLENEGLAVANTRFTYALGRLVLWSPSAETATRDAAALRADHYSRLAIANPKLAPYGAAAQDVLEQLGLWSAVQDKLVRATNISQTLHFVQSGAADLGFVALSQLQEPRQPLPENAWLVPQSLHQPIAQQAVVIRDSEAARAFMAFIQSAQAREMIAAHGYGKAQVHHGQ